jgi:hypothetical protein
MTCNPSPSFAQHLLSMQMRGQHTAKLTACTSSLLLARALLLLLLLVLHVKGLALENCVCTILWFLGAVCEPERPLQCISLASAETIPKVTMSIIKREPAQSQARSALVAMWLRMGHSDLDQNVKCVERRRQRTKDGPQGPTALQAQLA